MTYRYDQQNGAEGLLFMLAAQNPGADFLCGIGSCYNAVGMSAEMMLIQTEWLKAARFLSAGLSTDNLQKGLASLGREGHGGNFLMDDLTIELLRSQEFYSHELLDYSGSSEAASLLESAHQKAEDLIAGYKSPVPVKIQDGLRAYFAGLYEKMA
jgi:trimethylamine:corrinoid methyltransferase-like protein